jgi:hypothetical protein
MRWVDSAIIVVFALILMSQLAWVGTVNGSSEYSTKYAINYDPDLNNAASYWRNSTWNPSQNPADYWMKAENGIVTLRYKANRTDWGNTEVYQGKKPAYEIEKPLRFQDYQYDEGSGGLRLRARVRRDVDPEWQGSPLSTKSLYPQANIGVYIWLEVEGWNYDRWNETSSLVIDLYFDSRHEDPTSGVTITSKVGESYEPTTTPYDPQIHAGYVIGTLPLNTWQEFDEDLSKYIDQTLQKCRDAQELPELPSNKIYIKFFGVYVDSFSATVQASFDYVLLEDTSYEELLMNYTNLMYAFAATTVAFLAAIIYLAVRKSKAKEQTNRVTAQ